jgi:hypothetical protein
VGHVIIGAQMPITQQFLPPLAGVPQPAQSESTRHDEGHELPPEDDPPDDELEELDELPPEDVPPEPDDIPPPEELLPEEPALGELSLPLVPTVPPSSEVPTRPAGCGESVPHATTMPSTRHTTVGSLKSDKVFMRAFLLDARSG